MTSSGWGGGGGSMVGNDGGGWGGQAQPQTKTRGVDTVRVPSNVDLIRAPDLCQWKLRCPSWTPRPYGLCGRKATLKLIPKPKLDTVRVPSNVDLIRAPDLCQWKSRCPSWTPRLYSPYGLYGRKATLKLIPEPKPDKVRVLSNVDLIRAPDLRRWKPRWPSWAPRP